MADEHRGASIRPSEMVPGGLRLDKANGLLREARFCTYNYNDTITVPVLAVRLRIVTDDGVENEQYYSAGDLSHFQPSADGHYAEPVGGKEELNNSSNLAALTTALVNAGFPENRLDPDITCLEWLYAFWQMVAGTKREGLQRAEGSRGLTILIPTQIHNLPWETAKSPAVTAPAQAQGVSAPVVGAPVGAPVAATPTLAPIVPNIVPPAAPVQAVAPTPVVEPSGDLTGDALSFLATLIQEREEIGKLQLSGFVFARMASHPQRNELAKLVFQQAFIDQAVEMGIVTVAGDVLSRPSA